MKQRLNDFSPAVVIPAIEESLREYWGNYGHAPLSELHDSPELLRFSTGVPFSFLNGASSRQLSPERVDTAIDETISFFQKRSVPWEWIVGPQPVPISLPESLMKHGFVLRGESPGMAIHLDTMNQQEPTIDGLKIVPVNDDKTLTTWASTVVDGFELPSLHTSFGNLECSLGSQQPFYRRFLAYLHQQPVAASAVYLGEKVAGIYCVATLPAARKMGIGGAITQHALLAARAQGYHVAVLQASQGGRRVYERLGFKDFSILRGNGIAG